MVTIAQFCANAGATEWRQAVSPVIDGLSWQYQIVTAGCGHHIARRNTKNPANSGYDCLKVSAINADLHRQGLTGDRLKKLAPVPTYTLRNDEIRDVIGYGLRN